MNIRLLILAVVMLSTQNLFSQTGKIVGKILNGVNSEPLVSASVQVKETGRVVASDLNGNYTISNLKPGNYTLICSYVSLGTKTVDVKVESGEPTIQNIVLETSVQKSNDVVIRGGRVNKENVNAMLIAQKNSASVSDGISAEIIRKTPDRNTSDVLKRVSGASIQEDKFAIIRGLNDRYNVAMLNNSILPSSESDRKAFAFDIFPANMLDNLIIYKTATPDLPGELGGGAILINTKDIPAKDFHSISIGVGYNTRITFKDRLSYPGGKTDFLGLDDGARSLSSKIPAKLSSDPVTNQYLGYYIPNKWKVSEAFTAPNMSFQYTRGLTLQHKQRDLFGLLFSATYNRSYNFTDGVRRTNDYDRFNASDSSILRANYQEKIYTVQTLVGLIGNMSMKITDKNIISLKNIFSINADDRIILRNGWNDYSGDRESLHKSTARWFTNNQIMSSQLTGDHFLNPAKLKINWMASYTTVTRDIPNRRITRYETSPGDTVFRARVNAITPLFADCGSIFYSNTKEYIWNLRTDLQRNFDIGENVKSIIKAGVFYQYRNRAFKARQLGLARYQLPGSAVFDQRLLTLSEDSIFAKENMGTLPSGLKGFLLGESTKESDSYQASSDLFAAYAMLDQRFWKKLRLIYGVRMENFTQRLFALQSRLDTININTNKVDMLPSVNFVYAVTSKQNIRLAYSKTLNRPEYRELAPFAFYDYVTRFVVSGVDSLKRCSIDNYDIRYEYFPGRGQMISVSGFYKKFQNPIELQAVPGTNDQVGYSNVISAENIGAELEFRAVLGSLFRVKERSLLNKLTLFSNLAIIKSKVILTNDTTVNIVKDRPLQGQSPYVINAGLIYQDDDKGYTFTLSANRIGPRIFIAGDESVLDKWENGRTILDLQLAKSFKNNMEVKLNLKDILAQRLYFFEDVTENKKFDNGMDNIWSTTNYGRVISLSVSYKF